MNNFLEAAKKAYWKEGRRNTAKFRDTVRSLLLAKLRQAGEITAEDLEWVDEQIQEFFFIRE